MKSIFLEQVLSKNRTFIYFGQVFQKLWRYINAILPPFGMGSLTDIPRQREEYEAIYGTRRNAECHITSILRAGVEYLFYFITNSRYFFVTK